MQRSPRKRAPTPSSPAADISEHPSAVRVLRRFRVVFNAVRSHFHQVESRVGLGGSQVWALSLIRDWPHITVGELARRMEIHQSTASNLVKQLVVRELVGTTPDPNDKRASRLHVLPAGTQALRRWRGPYVGVLPTALNAMDDETLARLDQDLGKLIALLGVDESAGGVPLADA